MGRSRSDVLAAWLSHSKATTRNVRSDGVSLFSYDSFEIARFIAPTVVLLRQRSGSPSRTTSKHISAVYAGIKNSVAVSRVVPDDSSSRERRMGKVNWAWMAWVELACRPLHSRTRCYLSSSAKFPGRGDLAKIRDGRLLLKLLRLNPQSPGKCYIRPDRAWVVCRHVTFRGIDGYETVLAADVRDKFEWTPQWHLVYLKQLLPFGASPATELARERLHNSPKKGYTVFGEDRPKSLGMPKHYVLSGWKG